MQDTQVWLRAIAEVRETGSLSAEEITYASRLSRENDRRRFRVARTLLREIAAGMLGIPPGAVRFEFEEHGKPYLPGRPFEVNLAHSGDLVAVAAGPDALGIDVEQIKARTHVDAIAERYFHGEEIRWLRGLPENARREAFFSLWTVKEAAMKADGGGVWLNLASIRIDDPSRAGQEAVRCLVNGVDWHVRPLDVPAGYRAALATRGPTAITFG